MVRRAQRAACLSAALILSPAVALAHELATPRGPAGPQNAHELWRAWSFEPWIVVPLALTLLLYMAGVRAMWRAAGVGRGIRRREVAWFLSGWLALVIALVSPLHPWGEVLFSAHMGQHELLMLVAAPLLVLGRPIPAFLKALPSAWIPAAVGWTRARAWRPVWHALTIPLVAWAVHAATLWAWHAPALFQAALRSEGVHALQHVSFLASALLFWWAVVGSPAGAIGRGAAVLFMFTTAFHSGLLGALLTLAGNVWYPAYAGSTPRWGMTALEDQQLGGLIMWIPACLVYLAAAMALTWSWLGVSGARVRRREADLAQPAVAVLAERVR